MIEAKEAETPGWNLSYIDEENAPHEFICPISRQIMKNPVITVDGYSFERQVIEKWLKQRDKSPITGLRIEKQLIQNRALKQAIRFHNQRQNKANQNAQKLLQSSNLYLKRTLPQLINDVGLIDIDKLITLCIDSIELRKCLLNITNELCKLHGKTLTRLNSCQCCNRYQQCYTNINHILKASENIIQTAPILKQLNVEAKQFEYLPLSCNQLRRIDFCQLKKQNFKTKIFKSYGIEKSSLEELVKRIRTVNNIPNSNFIHLWRTTVPSNQLFDIIKKQLSHQKCTYTRKILESGLRITNTKISFDQLNLNEGQYLIVQHRLEGEEVFRGQNVKCQYCYDMKPEKIKCKCEAVGYCSQRCAEKDKEFHGKQCKYLHLIR